MNTRFFAIGAAVATIMLAAQLCFGQIAIQPGVTYVATASAFDSTGHIIKPLPAGGIIVWQQSVPEVVDFTGPIPEDFHGTMEITGKLGLANTAPVTGTLHAVYQDVTGYTTQTGVVLALQPSSAPPTAVVPPTAGPTPPATAPFVRSLSISIAPK